MARRIRFIRFLLLAVLCCFISPAFAADPLPGDACTAAENAINTFQWNPTGDNGAPAAAGVTNAIFCIGNVRKSMMNFQAATGYVGIGNTAPGSMLDVGKAGTTLGTLRLEGNTSGYVQIQPAAAAGSWTATLPATAGTSGYVLSTDGTGITSWISNAGTASTALSGITAATGNQAGIANGAYTIQWNWDTAGGSALKLASTSTAATSNAQKMLEISLSGTNATSAQATIGLDVSNTHAGTTSTNYAIRGVANNGTSGNYGVYGNTASTVDGSMGAYGYESGATGVTYGVTGKTDSTTASAAGVYASATGATGATYGVYGTVASTTAGAAGGYFIETGASGATYGVYASNASTTDTAKAIYGYATGATGQTRGVVGQTNSTSTGAVGVFGNSSGATGVTYGVYGTDASTAGVGGYFINTAATGATYGVYGTNASATGYGGYFTNTNGGYALATGSGNVGIGTTAPSSALEVKGNVANSDVMLTITNTNSTGYSTVNFGNDTGGIAEIFITGSAQAAYGGANSLNLYQGANAPLTLITNATERMRITGAGNVGIGNVAPSHPLDVTGTIRTTQAVLNSSAVPTISTCGTSPPAATAGSSNNAGQFTLGTGATAACTVTFANAFPTTAFCTVTPATNYTGTYYISAQTKTAFTVTLGTGTASVKFNYSCGGN